MNGRDNASTNSKNKSFRSSIGGAFAYDPSLRASIVPGFNDSPPTSASTDTVKSMRARSTTTSESSSSGSPPVDPATPKQPRKSRMSFLSRFSHAGKRSPRLPTTEEPLSLSVSRSRADSEPPTPQFPKSPMSENRKSMSVRAPFDEAHSAAHTPEIFPLCVAYVQAIKAGSLPASTISSQTILKRNAENKEKAEKAAEALASGSRRGRVMHRGHAASKSGDFDWTRKIFVLVPGYLLQYSGYGMDDRLPEKILQMTGSSLAFASDAIPGKTWVLQVHRSPGDDGGVPERGSRLSTIKLKNFRLHSKISASALLLVFENAEDMESWLSAIRAEVARLGGRTTIIEQPVKEETPHDLRILLGEERTSEGTASEADDFVRRIIINREDSSKHEWSSSDENASKRASTHYRTSTEAGQSVVSSDQILLDQLRASTVGSEVERRPDSPDTSPERASFNIRDIRRRSAALSARSRSSVELRPTYSHEPGSPPPMAPNFSLPLTAQLPSVPHLSPLMIPQPSFRNTTPETIITSGLASPPLLSTTSKLPRQRPVSTSSSPNSNSRPGSPTRTRISPSTGKRRPLSMADARSPHAQPSHFPEPANRRHSHSKVSARSPSLNRRSFQSLVSPTAEVHGPPLFPPPSKPLPELPPDGPSSNDFLGPTFLRDAPRRRRRGSRGSYLSTASKVSALPEDRSGCEGRLSFYDDEEEDNSNGVLLEAREEAFRALERDSIYQRPRSPRRRPHQNFGTWHGYGHARKISRSVGEEARVVVGS